MTAEFASDLLHGALVTALQIALPGLVVLFAVTLVCSLLQTLTQMHDQSLTAVPRIVLGLLAILSLLPWMMDHLVAYTTDVFDGVTGSL